MSNDSSNAPGVAPAPLPTARVTWGPVAAIGYGFIAFIAAQFSAAFVISFAAHLFGYSTTATFNAIFGQFMFVLLAETLTVAAIIYFVRRRRASLRAVGVDKPRWSYLGYAVLGVLAYFAGYAVILSIVSGLVPSLNINQPQDIGFNHPAGGFQLALTFVSLVILPPLAEELLFRGFLFGGLRTKLPFVWATLLTSALFAVGHLEFGSGNPLLWVAALDTFTLSLVLCFIREKTGSIWSGVLIHALKNLVAFSALYIFMQ